MINGRVGVGGGGLRMALLAGCWLLSAPAGVDAGETPLVSAGTRVRVSTGPEVRLQDFRITTSYMKGRSVAEDNESLTLELDGHAMRLAKPNVQLSGTVQALDDETLTLTVERHASPIVIPRDAIEKLETVIGRRGHAISGAITGGVLGLALFALCTGGDFCSWEEDLGPGARLVGVTAGLGALIGAAIRSDKWAVVPMRSSRAGSQADQRAGLNISFALRF